MIFISYSGSVRRQACDCSWLISSELEGVGVISATFVFAYAFKNLLEEDWPQQTGIYQYRFFFLIRSPHGWGIHGCLPCGPDAACSWRLFWWETQLQPQLLQGPCPAACSHVSGLCVLMHVLFDLSIHSHYLAFCVWFPVTWKFNHWESHHWFIGIMGKICMLFFFFFLLLLRVKQETDLKLQLLSFLCCCCSALLRKSPSVPERCDISTTFNIMQECFKLYILLWAC